MNEVTLIPDVEAIEAGHLDFKRAVPSIRVRPGIIVQAYFYSCAACGRTVYDSSRYFGVPFNPSCPEKWYSLNRDGFELYYCPDHEVTSMFFVDGKPIK